jgi:hypothetical protein
MPDNRPRDVPRNRPEGPRPGYDTRRPGAGYWTTPFDKSEKGSLRRFVRGGAKLGFDLYDPEEDIKKPYQVTNRGGSRRSAPVEFKIEELVTSRD